MKIFKLTSLFLIVFCFHTAIQAQTPVVLSSDPGGFGSNGTGTTYDGGPTLPFDSNLSLIL